MTTNRRNFLKAGTATGILIALGMTSTLLSCSSESEAPTSIKKKQPAFTVSLEALSPALKDFYDTRFINAANGKNAQELTDALIIKQVITQDGAISKEKIALLAKSDSMVSYENLDYAETELQVYALAYLAHKGSMMIFADTDFLGGDLRAQKVTGVEECIDACKTDDACTGFTFAKESHPAPAKKNTCFLKQKPPKKTVTNKFYTSGSK